MRVLPVLEAMGNSFPWLLLVAVCNQKRLAKHCIAADVTGSRKTVLIQLCPSDHTVPSKLCIRQYPTKMTFPVTITKARGQMHKHVGIYLPLPVFPLASSVWHFPDPCPLQLFKGIDSIQKMID